MRPIALMRLRQLDVPEDILKKHKSSDLFVEQKYDGFKAMASRGASGTKIYSRNGKDLTSKAPEIADCLNKKLPKGTTVLGELVYISKGKQSLGKVQSVLHSARPARAIAQANKLAGRLEFIVYDLIEYKGQDYSKFSLGQRRAKLDSLISATARGILRKSKIYRWGDRKKAMSDALAVGGEGIVVKVKSSPYLFRKPGSSEPFGLWWKHKVPGEKSHTEDVILSGYAKREKRLSFKMYQFDSSGKKLYVGNVSNLPLDVEKKVKRLNDNNRSVVAEISHQQRHPSGKFRHPGWIRLRPDKPLKSATMNAKPVPKENPERRKLYIYPNKASREVARRALERRKAIPRSKRGGLDAIQAHEQGIGSGVMRARDIAAGKRINAYQVKAFFDRHRHNYVKARSDRKKWEDSKAWQAWDLWGGEPLRKQVEAAVRADKRKRAKSNPESDKMSKEKMTRRRTATRKPYTVYLVQDKPRGLVLYSFKSDELICPSASASEYAWLLGESALKASGTHIFTSDAKLKKFLRSSKKRILRGRPRYPNPRNSKVKDALAEEATSYTDFNEFANAYWNSCSRGLYWYATNERRFHIGLPEEKKISKGTFTVACSPELALQGKNEGKKFVAELDVTRLPKGSIRVKRGSGGAEIKIVGSAESIKIARVLDAPKAKRAFKWQLSILPSSKDELRQIWEKAWDKRKRDAKKEETRREKKAERELKRAEARAKEEAAAAKRQAKKARTKAEKARKGRVAAGKRAAARRSSAARTRAAKAEAASAKSSGSKAKGKKVVMGPADRVPNPTKTRPIRVNVNKVSR